MKAVFRRCDGQDSPPVEFIDNLVQWATNESMDADWRVNDSPTDVFVRASSHLAMKWDTSSDSAFRVHRLAGLCEVLRVLGMMESNCDWNEGRDVTNPREDSAETISAGCWQISYDSRALGHELFMMCREAGITNGVEFQNRMKNHRLWATGYTSRLLRRTWKHHGPLVRLQGDSVYQYLSMEAVAEFRAAIA